MHRTIFLGLEVLQILSFLKKQFSLEAEVRGSSRNQAATEPNFSLNVKNS